MIYNISRVGTKQLKEMKIVKFEIERKFELDKDRIIDKCLKFNANWYRNKIINNLEKKNGSSSMTFDR